MIIEDKDKEKEFDAIPAVDENGEPIYKIDGESKGTAEGKPDVGELSNTADKSEFNDTSQDLKDETSQE